MDVSERGRGGCISSDARCGGYVAGEGIKSKLTLGLEHEMHLHDLKLPSPVVLRGHVEVELPQRRVLAGVLHAGARVRHYHLQRRAQVLELRPLGHRGELQVYVSA